MIFKETRKLLRRKKKQNLPATKNRLKMKMDFIKWGRGLHSVLSILKITSSLDFNQE